MQQRAMCPGCPAEIVAQNIRRHSDDSQTNNGYAIFRLLRGVGGPVSRIIEQGATSLDEIKTKLDEGSRFIAPRVNPQKKYGDLTKEQITNAAIECMLRSSTGDCTLGKDTDDSKTVLEIEVAARRNIPPPHVRPEWMAKKD